MFFTCSGRPAGENLLTIHYYRFDRNYNGWNVWVWPVDPDGNGSAHEFGSSRRGGFVTAHIDMNSSVREIGFIIRRREGENEWAEKDRQEDIFTRARELWIIQGDPEIYTERPAVGKPPMRFAVADTPNTVTVILTSRPGDYRSFSVYQDGRKLEGTSGRGHDEQVIIDLHEPITDPSAQLTVRDERRRFADRDVTMRGILDKYYYDGDDLGLVRTETQSSFKLWAPTASAVSVALYDNAGEYNAAGRVTNNETDNLHPMMPDRMTGVWSAVINGDLDGKFYLYRVEFANGRINWAVDPYAKAVSANGQRGAVINLAETNPSGWRSVKPDFSGELQDAILYELHIRDFSIDEDSGMANKGKFLAFTERGTRNSAGFPTGVDHIVNLGITHVHLLPGFDFASVNELTVDDPSSPNPKFNWGYDPQNYNVPEGSYSTNPADPKTRIREYKQMVQALHNAGIRVVKDVVFNHTYTVSGSPFEATVPGYYYRTNEFGAFTDGSGCGNEVASERPMVRKFIVDSCLYWAREYNIDGYRFDLMALHDIDTMEEISERLRSEVDPTLIIYGEPWHAGGTPLDESLQLLAGVQRGMNIAVFNDQFRGAIKGGSDDDSRGFASGQTGQETGIVRGVRGSVDVFTGQANESINYVTAHDNLNLWDKFSISWGAQNMRENPYSMIDPGKPLFENNAVRSSVLANGIVFTAQGVPFFQAGDEFLRTKFGDHNSYESPDSINRIRWENAGTYREVVEYYQGLIQLRKAQPAFRMNSRADMDLITVLTAQDMLVAFTVGDNAGGRQTVFVAYNGAETTASVILPGEGTWYQVVNDRMAGVTPLAHVQGILTLPPLSMAVLHD